MHLLKNPRHEAFAQAYCTGGNATAAWQEVSGRRDAVTAARLLRRPDVIIRIEEVRRENEAMSRIKRDQALKILADIITTPVGQLTPASLLAEEWIESEHDKFVRMPSKLEALELLGRLCGWERGNQAQQQINQTLREMAEVPPRKPRHRTAAKRK